MVSLFGSFSAELEDDSSNIVLLAAVVVRIFWCCRILRICLLTKIRRLCLVEARGDDLDKEDDLTEGVISQADTIARRFES